VVICHHALEHVLEPVAALSEMRRLLPPEGRLLLWVPFEDERRHRRFERDEKNHHLYSWNPQTLGNLVETCGFGVREARLERYGWDRFAAAWAVRLGVGETGFRLLRRFLVAIRPLREVRILAQAAGVPQPPRSQVRR
jgi:SAM-dependent methyltransferase